MEGYLTQPRYSGKGLGPASNNVLDLVDSLWQSLPLSDGDEIGGMMEGVGGREGVGTGVGM